MSDVLMPQMGESVTEGTIVRWMKQVGETVDKDEPLFEISTDKVDAEIPSPGAGVVTEIRVSEGETVPVHTIVAVIDGADADAPGPATPGASAATTPDVNRDAPATSVSDGVRASVPVASSAGRSATGSPVWFVSPVVRRMSEVHGLDLSRVRGTGASGRITKRDVDAYLAGKTTSTDPGQPRALYQPGDDVRVEKMSVMRRKIADHMVTSLKTSAHVYSACEVDFSRVAALRQAHKEQYVEAGTPLTYTAFIAHAVAATLREFPVVNASLAEGEIVYRNDINLGIAVALDEGLIVPVIRNADELSLQELAAAVVDLAQRSRAKQLKVEDVEAGTFTVTNPGIFGGLWGLPIINQPQVAILAVGSIDKRAVVVDDRIEARPMAYFTLGYDHRLIDGADGGRFLQALKDRVEQFDEGAL